MKYHTRHLAMSLVKLCFMLFITIETAKSQVLERLNVYPLDLKSDGTTEFPGSVDQVEYLDGVLFIRSKREAFVTLAKPNGQIIQNIGQRGQGPGEFGGALKAMAVGHGHFFALASSPLDRLHHFSGSDYFGYLPVQVLRNSFLPSYSSKKIDVSATHVVLPAPPQSGHLGFAYDFQGGRTPIGSLIYDKKSIRTLEQNPLVNDTLWHYEEPYWFAVLRYENLVLKFDDHFQLVRSFELEHPRLKILKKETWDYDRSNFTDPPCLYFDLDFWQGSLYLLLRKTLVKLDPKNGVIARMYAFHGNGPDFRSGPDAELNFSTFTIMENGVIFLGPGIAFGHDLLRSSSLKEK